MEKDLEALKRDLRESMTRALVQFRLLEEEVIRCRHSLKRCDSIIRNVQKLKNDSEAKA